VECLTLDRLLSTLAGIGESIGSNAVGSVHRTGEKCFSVPGNPCSPGWHKMNCKCYLNSTAPMAWAEARRYCRERAGELAESDDDHQTSTLQVLLANEKMNGWIGLTDSKNEGTWTWVDSSPLTQEFWAKGQPDSRGGLDEDCAVFQSDAQSAMSSWHDYECSSRHAAICEKFASR
uniref:C-type lectin domain-containing protein n=1 Tax=Denticeps clupeoides TaxID=299321 RepID=A0AAY4ARI5_9TELE